MGVIPLMLASGSGAASRAAMGSAVFFGMLVATMIGVFIYPALFVLISWFDRKKTATDAAAGPPASSPEPAGSHGGGH
jgi:HAE1 family hydrophobic/amphiphilic exporter-1